MRHFRAHQFVVAVLFFGVVASSTAIGADVVYIETPSSPPYTQQQIEAAAKVYGLDLNVIVLTRAGDAARAIAAIKKAKSVAVVFAAEALQSSDGDQVLGALRRMEHRKPLMIAGITEQTDPAVLRKLSAGAIDGCAKSTVHPSDSYEVARADLTRQLSGSKLPLTQAEVQYLTFDTKGGAQWLIAATDGSVRHPILAQTVTGGQEIFFATAPVADRFAAPTDLYREPAVFVKLAPQILFLHYAAGERGWHSPGHYGNLTIDDIWLREPYGHVQYDGLLREMEQHNFHTTIAFIPWNFDRSEPAVISIFRAHPDRFSICVHGNNHYHQEFGPFDGRPLDGQIQDIKQGLARMAAFSKLTNLAYDPVMVFPHRISPQETLAFLKQYNFWATVNADNVPSDAIAPSDSEFALRAATLAFANFPSLRRYSTEHPIPDWQLAMDAFLGNPMMFYAHEAFFATGIDAFDELAEKVNRLQPDTEWRSLGDIVRHLYLEKLREDGNYDIRLLSPVVRLDNRHGHDAVFFLEKAENGDVPLTVSVDGQPHPYELMDGRLRLQVPLRDGMSREISIKYQNDLDLSKIDISKASRNIAAVRYLSDFRDNVVSRTALGRWFIRSYVANRTSWNRAVGFLAGLLILIVTYWYLRNGKQRRAALRSSFVAKP